MSISLIRPAFIALQYLCQEWAKGCLAFTVSGKASGAGELCLQCFV